MKTDPDLERRLLEHVLRAEYRPVKPRVIAKQLKLDEGQAAELKRVVKQLVKRGRLAYGANHLVAPVVAPLSATASIAGATEKPTKPGRQQQPRHAGKDGRHVSGVFRRTQGGFGFVRPTGTPPSADRAEDIYIAVDKAGDAASGDVVLVRLDGRRDGRRGPSGTIVEVIERETHQFVGTYLEKEGAAYVQVDGTVFASPVFVGDPGAKNACQDDKVVFEMVRFPSPAHDGEGVITEVLGPRGAPGVDTLSIVREFELPGEFAEDAQEEARRQADAFDETDLRGRKDLTAETIVTIDPVDARDFDDAISLSRSEKGHWWLGVHIADVSHFVRPHSPLDREAYNRATSVYLPDRVIPMIPEIISNGLASLQPDRVRFTKTVFIEFTPDGVPVHAEAHAAAIVSKRRFTYEEVDEYLADRAAWKKKLAPEVHALLGRMHELAMILRKRRMTAGSLELSMREVKIDLDRDGQVTGAHTVVNTESHQVIEEFMLAANEAVARMLRDAKLHFLRRVHSSPDPRKLKALTEFVAELGFKTESLESRFELQRLLRLVEGRPEQQAVNYAVLRSLQRAAYSPEAEGHYALASDCYCHFTSPIRRYPDLTVHRLLEAVLAKSKPRNDLAELVAQGEHCSERERRAESAERELTKVKLLTYLSTRIGQELEAVVTGVETFGLFAQGVDLPAEGLIHITSLTDDFYRFDRRSHSLMGNRSGNMFRLGDRVLVAVAAVDVDRRELDFRIVHRKKRLPPAPKPGKASRGRPPAARGKAKAASHGNRGKGAKRKK